METQRVSDDAPSASSQKVSKPEPAGDLMAQGSQVLRPEVFRKGSKCRRAVPLSTLASFPYFAAVRGEGRFL